MDTEKQVLIGKEFWEIVGKDPNTYNDFLEVYRKVGREKGAEMIDKLALGY
ncbi:MAG: TdeIII family type II restriction endonuclease [Proteobacteria bacterium]|nr:TdeIII family type II restriction endonuclease [Pseudomonadota bacterium]